MNQFEVGVPNYENLQNLLKDIPNGLLNFFGLERGSWFLHIWIYLQVTKKSPAQLK